MANKKARQEKILCFMREELKEKGYPPTVREICAAVGIKSTSTAHKDIKELVEAGFLVKDPAKPRALMLAGHEEEALTGGSAPVHNDIANVPIIGRIAAGIPILAEQNIEDYYPVPAACCSGKEFMLRISGDSMINAGIMDGDLILVEQQEEACSGEIVAVLLDGSESEATVKTFYREAGHIRLQPENDNMSPIIVHSARILGRVKGVFRYYL